MPRNKNAIVRGRPSTPNSKYPVQVHQQLEHTADPSPPVTPTTSPPLSRKMSLKPRHQPPFIDEAFDLLDEDPAIQPVGQGHQFSYQPRIVTEQLSPQSSSSTSAEKDVAASEDVSLSPSVASLSNQSGPLLTSSHENEESHDEFLRDALADGASDADSESERDDGSELEDDEPSRIHRFQASVRITTITTQDGMVCDFIIEDVDPMDSENDGLDVLLPTEVESMRSQSRPRRKDHLDTGFVDGLKNLNCSAEASDDDDGPVSQDYDFDEIAFLKRREELRRFRRVSMSSSFGKRTHSELSDSDPDDYGIVDVNEVGSSAHRMRKRLHRTSLLFQDPPAPRIDELEEPDSSEDERAIDDNYAMELPYWTMEIMEVETP